VKWIEIVLAMWFAIDLAQRRGIRWIVVAALLTMTLQSVIGIYEARWRGSGPLGFRMSEGVYRAYGTFEQPNPFAGFIGLGLPIVLALTAYYGVGLLRKMPVAMRLRHFARWIACGIVALMLAAALYLSFSRGAWLGAVAAIGAMLVFAPRRLWIGIGLMTIALALLIGLSSAGLLPVAINERLADAGELFQFRDVRGAAINDANYALIERLARWQAALNMLTDQPWTGVGFGNYQAVYEQYRLLNWPTPLGHAHNIYLNVAAETGLPGLAAYVLLWVVIFGLTNQTIRRSNGIQRALAVGLLGTWTYLSVHNLVDNLYVNNTPLLIGVLLGLLVALRPLNYPPRTFPDL
jgi:O-antigen ligase